MPMERAGHIRPHCWLATHAASAIGPVAVSREPQRRHTRALFGETAKLCPVLADGVSNQSVLALRIAHGRVRNIQTHRTFPLAMVAPHAALIGRKSKIAPSHADAARNPSLHVLLDCHGRVEWVQTYFVICWASRATHAALFVKKS